MHTHTRAHTHEGIGVFLADTSRRLMGTELALCHRTKPVDSAAELPTTIAGRHLGKTWSYLRKGLIPSCAKCGSRPGQVRTNHSPNPHYPSPEKPALLQSEAAVCKGQQNVSCLAGSTQNHRGLVLNFLRTFWVQRRILLGSMHRVGG